MALIKCPECGQQISDKAQACIHCGYPLQEIHAPITPQKPFLFVSYAVNNISVRCTNCNRQFSLPTDKFTGISSSGCICKETLICPACNNANDAGTMLNKEIPAEPVVKCPKCGSPQIATLQRGFNIVSGVYGSGSARNVCQKCGYRWKPR